MTTAAMARSRRASRTSIGADGTRDRHTRSGFAGDPREQVGPRSRIQDVAGLDPGAARLADAPAHVVELVRVVRVGVDRQEAAHADGPPGTLDGQVQARRRPVHLEGRAGAGRLGEDDVPVEVEVIALADLPAGRVRDDIDMRAADPVERPLRQFGARLATGDVHRGDDEVEPREQVVVVVERAVRPDLQLAAMQQSETLRAASPAGAVPAASSAAKRALSPAMISRCCSTRSGARPRAIASDCVWSVRTW